MWSMEVIAKWVNVCLLLLIVSMLRKLHERLQNKSARQIVLSKWFWSVWFFMTMILKKHSKAYGYACVFYENRPLTSLLDVYKILHEKLKHCVQLPRHNKRCFELNYSSVGTNCEQHSTLIKGMPDDIRNKVGFKERCGLSANPFFLLLQTKEKLQHKEKIKYK